MVIYNNKFKFCINNLKSKLFLVLFLVSILVFIFSNYSSASPNINLTVNKTSILKDETFDLSLVFSTNDIASFTVNIYFDDSKIEYQKNIENSNSIDNRIIYTWTASNFSNLESELNNLPKFTFKGLENGIANIFVTGEFYDSNGNTLDIGTDTHELLIGSSEVIPSITYSSDINNIQNLEPSNSLLSTLRLNVEGLTPNFSPDVFEYYFIADESLTSLDNISYLTQNPNSEVSITGNMNLKSGINVIKILVTAENKMNTSEYIINLSKTSNPTLANSNLETLAVEQGLLSPTFDPNITNYTVFVNTTTEVANILAIAENSNSTVNISVPETLDIGDNLVTITVLAEDGFTSKTYYINIHRRTVAEEDDAIAKESEMYSQLSSLISSNELTLMDSSSTTQEIDNTTNSNYITSLVISLIVVIFAIIIVIYFLKFRNRNKKV